MLEHITHDAHGAQAEEEAEVKPLANRSDDEILRHLPDYLAGGGGRGTINGYLIEAASSAPDEMLAILTLDEDELEGANFTSPVAMAIKAKLLAEKASRAANEHMADQDNARRRDEERKAQWDMDFHDFGGQTWSGKDLRAFLEWTGRPEVLDAIDQDMIAAGYKPEEVKTMRQKFEEARLLKLKEANGEKLTPEEKKRLDDLNKDPQLVTYSRMATNSYKLSKEMTQGATLKQGAVYAIAVESRNKEIESSMPISKVKKINDFAQFIDLSEQEKTGTLNKAEAQKLAELKQNKDFTEFAASAAPIADGNQSVVTKPVVMADNKPTDARETFPTAANARDDFRAASTAANINTLAPVAKTPQPIQVAVTSSANLSL